MQTWTSLERILEAQQCNISASAKATDGWIYSNCRKDVANEKGWASWYFRLKIMLVMSNFGGLCGKKCEPSDFLVCIQDIRKFTRFFKNSECCKTCCLPKWIDLRLKHKRLSKNDYFAKKHPSVVQEQTKTSTIPK